MTTDQINRIKAAVSHIEGLDFFLDDDCYFDHRLCVMNGCVGINVHSYEIEALETISREAQSPYDLFSLWFDRF